ncbi:MAG: 3-dehydroquinate synthase [Desulfobacterales bacterium]|nr:3-dehydroquinate synthase [Desulfobacterales bacterium]MDJ0988708.1 3-dehydroquinate synthase [Desulfobacterales bacterium]
MQTVRIQGQSGPSDITVGERIESLADYLPSDVRCVIVTDANVERLHRHRFPSAEVITIGTGEKIKTLESVAHIYRELIRLEADRFTFVVAIGGGLVCDVAGFAASTYMRGLPYGFVATTLLAQVDASVGGKNGVNFDGYKNMVGVFNQPRFVICDLNLLNTLPSAELANGLAEIVKHAAICDREYFNAIENHVPLIEALDPVFVEELVLRSVLIKSQVVNRDEQEAGERRKLNFGHTFGHAIEKCTGLAHGEAVSIGMVIAARFSQRHTGLAQESRMRLTTLLRRLGLPTELPVAPAEILQVLGKDKKRQGDSVHFVCLERLGSSVVNPVGLSDLAAFLTAEFETA